MEELRSKAALAALPEEFRAIDQAPQVTRADLAALVGIRLAPLLQAGRRSDAALITDVRGNWAATWIMSVARAGVMEPFANHAFQPRTIVRRADLAQALARLLAQVAQQNPARAKAWDSARLEVPRSAAESSGLSGGVGCRRGGRHDGRAGWRVSARASGHWR